jgi:serine/threonine-protein kinase HipA
MATTSLYVFCYLPGEVTAVPAGRFDHDDLSGVGSFAYGHLYLERPNALPVDPVALPLGVDAAPVTTNGGLYGAFRDASPDYWGRLVIASGLRAPPESLTEIDYLTHTNATRVGNLDFRLSLDASEPVLAPPEFQDIDELLKAAEGLERGRVVDEHMRLLLEQGSSLGGARPKCTLILDGEMWIAKFPARHDWISVPRLEYATTQLAAHCGLNTPETRLETVGGRDVFLARRFDRDAVANGWARRGYLSALSLAEWDERDRNRWSYRTVADRIRRHSEHVADDLRELFLRIAFNILVRNTDDHPRNHGFLLTPDGLNLSPLFDVEPTRVRPGVGTEYFLAMGVGEQGRLAAMANLCSAATAFNLSPSEADSLTRQMRDCVVTSWRDVLGAAGFAESDLEMLALSFGG